MANGFAVENLAGLWDGAARELASLHEVIFCCFSRADLLIYERLLARTGCGPSGSTLG